MGVKTLNTVNADVKTNSIYSVNGPVVKGKDTKDKKRLIGEVIGVSADFTTIQVYEGTGGLMPGEPVESTGAPMEVTLGPGIISNIFDGIQRPLAAMGANGKGAFIEDGIAVAAIDTEKEYDVTVCVKVGDTLHAGEIYATCPETPLITHKCMLTPNIKEGKVTYAAPNGKYRVNDTVVKIDVGGKEVALTLCQKWPIRTARPVAEHRLRRARQRDDTGAGGIFGAYRPENQQTSYRKNNSHSEYLEYACCGKRGFYLHGYNAGGILQRYGLPHRNNGRLYLTLG